MSWEPSSISMATSPIPHSFPHTSTSTRFTYVLNEHSKEWKTMVTMVIAWHKCSTVKCSAFNLLRKPNTNIFNLESNTVPNPKVDFKSSLKPRKSKNLVRLSSWCIWLLYYSFSAPIVERPIFYLNQLLMCMDRIMLRV